MRIGDRCGKCRRADRPDAGETEPACWTIVVDCLSFFSSGNPITEFGATRIVSSPRTRSTRP
jgi:hypothetical protein